MKKSKIVLVLMVLSAVAAFTACKNSANSSSDDGNKNKTYIGNKAPDEAKEVGDIVFNDGSAMHYTDYNALDDADKDEKKTSAIAIIFYKGTTGNAPLGLKTLGVGLVQSQGGPWCKNTAAAYNVNIDVIQCAADAGGTSGKYTFENALDTDGSNNLEQIAVVLGSNNDTGTGTNSTTTAEEAAELYPSFYFAKNYKNAKLGSETESRILSGSKFEKGWYIPTLAELMQLYKNSKGSDKFFDLDTLSVDLGGSAFNSAYWSSSQAADNDGNAYWVMLSAGDYGSMGKAGIAVPVCAIRVFN